MWEIYRASVRESPGNSSRVEIVDEILVGGPPNGYVVVSGVNCAVGELIKCAGSMGECTGGGEIVYIMVLE